MSFLCMGNPDYRASEILRKMSPEEYAAFRLKIGRSRLPEIQDEVRYISETLMDAEELQHWTDAGISVTLSRVKGLNYSTALPHAAEPHTTPGAMTVVNVSVSGVGLLDIRNVTWLEDCCTEELQKHLDAGWKILAVCPPNDTRRPTYIIGRPDFPGR